MIPHTFIVRFWRVGQAIESQEFSGPDRRSRARGFALVKKSQGYQTLIVPVGY